MTSLGLQNKYLRTGSIIPVIIKTLYLTLYPMVLSCYINTNCCWHLIWFPWFTQTKTYTPYILCTFLFEPEMLIEGKQLKLPPTALQPYMFTLLQGHGHILIPKRVSSPILVRNDSRSSETFRGEQWTWNKRAVKFATWFLFFSPYTSAMQVFHLCAQWVAEIYCTPTSFPAALAHVRCIKILTWLRGFRVKIANFSRLHCLATPRGDLSTKKTKPSRKNDQKASESC